MTYRFLLFYAGNEKGYCQDTKHFTDEIAGELYRRGHQIFICDLIRESHNAAALKAYISKGVDVVLTFNGEAIQAKELWQLWNQLGALVVNILMDPPFHIDLLSYLESPNIKRYLLLCPDENHVEFVKRYFPQVKHVEFMPHGGTPARKQPIPWERKPINLLFCGTYIQPEKFSDIMEQKDEFGIYSDMRNRLLHDGSLSIEKVMEESIGIFSCKNSLPPDRINKIIPGMNLLEGWIRMVTRERVITALVDGGIDLYVLGNGWQDHPCSENRWFHRLSNELIPFPDTLKWIDKAQITLNIMPWFKAGSHDRVFNAMLRKSIALTDPSSYFQNYFQNNESIVYYSLENLEELPDIVHNLFAHPEQTQAIAINGYKKAAAFTWENYVETLLSKIDSLTVPVFRAEKLNYICSTNSITA